MAVENRVGVICCNVGKIVSCYILPCLLVHVVMSMFSFPLISRIKLQSAKFKGRHT